MCHGVYANAAKHWSVNHAKGLQSQTDTTVSTHEGLYQTQVKWQGSCERADYMSIGIIT